MLSNQNEDKPLSWTVDELFMALNEHILVEMLDRTPKEISTESSTKEMRLGMVLGESLNISHIIWLIWYESYHRVWWVYLMSSPDISVAIELLMFIKLPIFDKHLYGEDFASNLRKNIKNTCKFSKKRVINHLMKFWELWKLIWRKMEKWVQVKASSQWVSPILAEDYR